jgi:hypothetical protein
MPIARQQLSPHRQFDRAEDFYAANHPAKNKKLSLLMLCRRLSSSTCHFSGDDFVENQVQSSLRFRRTLDTIEQQRQVGAALRPCALNRLKVLADLAFELARHLL